MIGSPAPLLTPTERTRLAVARWNHTHPVGTPVRYWPGERTGDGQHGTTRTPAHLLGGHTPVVWVTGHPACVALTHIEPLGRRAS